jgi:hypothetical protein
MNPVPHAGIGARVWLEIRAGIRHLKAAPAIWWPRPPPSAILQRSPAPRRVRGSMSLCTLVTFDP